jgi:uncharacterized repeat protein (TIGR03837 family)
MVKALKWDIFCQVIDNFGDIGVSWRLACQLAQRGQQVQLFVDDPSALAWMAPQGHDGVQVRPWTDGAPRIGQDTPCDILVEAFGCEINPAWVASVMACKQSQSPRWINLEYLSAEPFVQRCHGLSSPVLSGPAAGYNKQFFYPGFTEHTGGLLREPDLAERQAIFDSKAWLAEHGVGPQQHAAFDQTASLFCYEPAALPSYLHQLRHGPLRTLLLVTPGRAAAAVKAYLAQNLGNKKGSLRINSFNSVLLISEHLSIIYLPSLPQPDYDHLLWSSSINMVRGEDSLVRALWAGKPFVWHIYPQDNGAHAAKLEAFLDWLGAPEDVRRFHHVWNGLSDGVLPVPEVTAWTRSVQRARARLVAQADLVTQLFKFCDVEIR